jgi:hypothetical protein
MYWRVGWPAAFWPPLDADTDTEVVGIDWSVRDRALSASSRTESIIRLVTLITMRNEGLNRVGGEDIQSGGSRFDKLNE